MTGWGIIFLSRKFDWCRKIDASVPLDPEDAALLLDDEVKVKKESSGIRKKDRPTDKGVAWLVKTQYVSPINLDPAKQVSLSPTSVLSWQSSSRKGCLFSIICNVLHQIISAWFWSKSWNRRCTSRSWFSAHDVAYVLNFWLNHSTDAHNWISLTLFLLSRKFRTICITYLFVKEFFSESVLFFQAMTEKQAKDLREQREGRRIDVETGNDRYVLTHFPCGHILYSLIWNELAGRTILG